MPSNQKQTKNKWLFWKSGFSWSNFLFLPFLFLSTVFWLSTKLSSELQYRKSISIVYQTDDDLVLKNILPEKIDATLSGQGWDLVFLKKYSSQHPFVYRIPRKSNLISKADIISQLNLSVDNLGIRVEDLNFSSEPLDIEKKLVKKLPVFFDGKLEFTPFYKLLGKIVFEPDSVELTGPESLIRNLEKYPTRSREITDIQKDLTVILDLRKPDEHYLRLNPEEVKMHLRTEQLTQKKLRVPVHLAKKTQRPVSIVPGEIEIHFLIGLSEFQGVSAEDFSAQIIISEDQLPNQQYAVSIVKKPVNVRIQEIIPAYVDVFYGE
jgi:hypothetical protein